jgi:hypothetical protein
MADTVNRADTVNGADTVRPYDEGVDIRADAAN